MSMYVQPLAFMEGLGGMEVFIVMVVILVLFGGEKLPEFARGAGKLIREFKKASSGVEEEFKRALEEEDRKKSIAAPVSPPYVPPVTEPVIGELPSSADQSAFLAPEPTPGSAEAFLGPPDPAPASSPPAPIPPVEGTPPPTTPSLKPSPPPKMLPDVGDDLGL